MTGPPWNMEKPRSSPNLLVLLIIVGATMLGVTWQVVETEHELVIRCTPLPVDHPCAGDIDGDGIVGARDFMILSDTYGSVCEYP